MIWDTFDFNRDALKMQYKLQNWNENSGLSVDVLKDKCFKIVSDMSGQSKIIIKAKVIEFILDNAQIEVNPCEWFADKINHGNIMHEIRKKWQTEINQSVMMECIEKNKSARKCMAYTGDVDYGHTSPDWNVIMNLGISGILERVRKASLGKSLTEKQKEFYYSCEIVYEAVKRFIKRLSYEAKQLEKQNEKMSVVSQSLLNLAEGAPTTMLEAMQLTIIYYNLQNNIECENVRSLGGLDKLYYKFYKSDIESRKYTDKDIRELIRYFLNKFNAMNVLANIPFYLCGTDENGMDNTNELSYMILEEYRKLDILDPKIHIRYHKDIPRDFLKLVLKIIREGKNSFVFMNDAVIEKALMNLGESAEDARNYTVIGCYEPAAMGKEVPCTCNGRINITKAIELVLYNGKDPLTEENVGLCTGELHEFNKFYEFYAAVKKQLEFFVCRCREEISMYERYYMEVNPSPLFSATLTECVEQGVDAYAGGAKYNNSSICAFGLATVVDSLTSIKKAVYEDKIVTLAKFAQILKENWQGYEVLQLKFKNSYPKYGNNNNEADNIMTDLTEIIASQINKYPNGRGGVFRCGLFSIDWRIGFGKKTGATPDGRNAYEPLSKNMCAVTGQDKGGITQLINSVTKIDYTHVPNGTVLDIMLHQSAVQGDEGLMTMLGILITYMKRGGFALQCNIFDPKVLKEAQMNPKMYSTLQVRVCGWNVYFVDLSKEEQDEFIKQAENSLG